jgi:hypothetical protein
MNSRFMMSVAAVALLAGTGFANAQGTGGPSREGGAAGAPAQQAAPSERGAPSAAPTNRDSGAMKSESGGMNNAQSKEGMSKDGMKNAQSKEGMSKDGMKDAQSKEGMSKDRVNNAQTKEGMGKDGTKDAQSKEGMSKSGTNNAQSTDSKSTTTTGNAATSATAAPPAEKRTQITSAIKSEKIEETTNVNFELNIGTRVPTSVRFYPLPPRIVEIYPEWRGYEVIRVHGRYVIIRPESHEIVYIIEG